MIPEIKTMQRDLKLGQISGSNVITLDTKGLPSGLYFWWKKRKIIKSLLKKGYILSGSRALKCYRVNGNEVLNREARDWDFLVTKDQFMDICKEQGIYDFDFNAKSYQINKHLMAFANSYSSDTIIVPTNIELFIKDTLPDYVEHDGIRFAKLSDIIDAKMDLMGRDSKHKLDLNNIYVNVHGNDL
jgi:hypothetical protein